MLINEGTWSDLTTLSDGRVVLVYSTPTGWYRVIEADTGRTIIERNYSKWFLHLRAAGSSNGHILGIGQDHTTGEALFNVDGGTLATLGPTPGISPVEAISVDDGWHVYVLRPGRYDVYSINQFGTYELLDSRPTPTSQGFLQCDGGVVKLTDDFRTSVPGLVCPTVDSGYSLGQNAGPDPARLRISDTSGRLAAVYTGYSQPPRVLISGQNWYGTAYTSQGTWLGSGRLVDIPWGNDTAQPIPPDIPWTTDPTKHIADVLPYIEAASTARQNYDGGRFTLWLRKSHERPDWGEWWHGDADFIGLLEDRSTAYRMYHGKPTPPMADGMTEQEALTLPLASYTWTPGSLWMKRSFTGKWSGTIRTNYVWWNWETWKNLRVQITMEAGYGRFAGHEVFVKQTYRKPSGWEQNYFGPTGWRKFEVFDEDGTPSGESINTGMAEKGPFVSPRFSPNYPINQTSETAPDPEMDTQEAIKRAGYPAPSDIVQGALNVFYDNLLDRDKTGPDTMTGGAYRYFMQYYFPKMSEQQVAFGIPGSAEGWGHYSQVAVNEAKRIYDRDQKGQPAPPSQVNGRLRRVGKEFHNDLGHFNPIFSSCLYGLADGRNPNGLLDQLASMGFNGVRVFAGYLDGRGQTPESALAHLGPFIESCGARGLYCYVVALTDTALLDYNVSAHVQRVAEICNRYPNTLLELANEVGHPTQRSLDLAGLYNIARNSFSGVITYGAREGQDELINDSYPTAGGDFITAHLRRDVSPGGVPMPWYHEASRLTELSKIRDFYNCPGFSGEPNRVEEKDNPIGFAFLLGAITAGLGLGTVFHSAQSRDAEPLSGIQEQAALAFIEGYKIYQAPFLQDFINGHWAEAPVSGVKWYDPPSGAQAWRIFTFTSGNTGKMLITGSPNPPNWRNSFADFKNGWSQTGEAIWPHGCPTINITR